MRERSLHRNTEEHIAPCRYQAWFTCALLTLLLLHPLLEYTRLGNLVLVMLSNVIVIAALYAVSWNNRRLAAGLLLALPSLIFTWSFFFQRDFGIQIAQICSAILFFAYTLVTTLQRIFRTKRVGVDELFGALNAYILIAGIWGMFYFLVETFHPGAFVVSELPRTPSTFIYFSFSTLGTLGMGDVRPLLPFARALAIVEMLVGLFFVTVSFGKLVAVFRFEINAPSRDISEKPPFERTVRLLTSLPRWSLILFITAANLGTSLINEQLHMPLFMDTWATSAGTILGGVWVGIIGGVLYNILMSVLVWPYRTWAWMFSSILVAIATHFFWKRKWIDLNRPFALIACGLVMAVANTLLGIVIVNLAKLPPNPSTMELHTQILAQTGSPFVADFVQQVLMESMDKTVCLLIAMIVVFAINEFKSFKPGKPEISL